MHLFLINYSSGYGAKPETGVQALACLRKNSSGGV